jgi:hypothetical protein
MLYINGKSKFPFTTLDNVDVLLKFLLLDIEV